MKPLYIFCVLFACAATVVADGWSTAALSGSLAASVSETSPKISGELDAIVVDVSGSSTQSITVASGDETLFSIGGVTADAVYRPRAEGVTATNGTLANAIGERFCISGEALTVTVTATQVATNDVTVKLKFK